MTPPECYDYIPTSYGGESCIDYKWLDLDGFWHVGQPRDISNCLNVQRLTTSGSWCDVTPVSCQGSILPTLDYGSFLDCKWLDLNGIWQIGTPLDLNSCLNIQILDYSGSWFDASPLSCLNLSGTASPLDIFSNFIWCDLDGNWFDGYPNRSVQLLESTWH